MDDSWVCEELYQPLRLPNAVASRMVNKIFGSDRFIKISKGRLEFLVRLRKDSRAFKVCKESERKEMLALGREEVALRFWSREGVACFEEWKKSEEIAKSFDSQYSKSVAVMEQEIMLDPVM